MFLVPFAINLFKLPCPTLYVKLTDAAGNTVTKNTPIKIDKTGPTLTLTNSSDGAWTNEAVKITAEHSDSMSGMNKVEYSHDNSEWLTGNWDASSTTAKTTGTWTGERNNTFYVRATDKAGNTTKKNTAIKIDKTCPTLAKDSATYSSSGNVKPNKDGFYLKMVIKVTEQGSYKSGVKKVQYDHCYNENGATPKCSTLGYNKSSAKPANGGDWPRTYDTTDNYYYSYKDTTLYGYWKITDNAGNKCYYNYKVVWNNGKPSTFSQVASEHDY